MQKLDEYPKIAKSAGFLGVSQNTLRMWADTGRIPVRVNPASCPWSREETRNTWLTPRAIELTFTAWDLEPFAKDCGYDGPPFRWEDDRRFLLRCELDVAYFHLYGIERDDVDYILETFPIVKRKGEAAHGEDRGKRVIMEIYDAGRVDPHRPPLPNPPQPAPPPTPTSPTRHEGVRSETTQRRPRDY